MSKLANVVDGEASESDSDIEIAKPDSNQSPEQFIIAGEAPESDDEINQRTALESPQLSTRSSSRQSNPRTMQSSLLHQKLWESNVSLRASIESLVKHTIGIAVENLTSSDKTLLNVQESMRSTIAHMTLARARLKQIHLELEKANCSAALPTVKIKL